MADTQNFTDTQLAITAYGLKTVTGDQDFALFGAIAANLTASSEDAFQEVPSRIKENSYDPALTAPISELEDFEPDIRMLLSLQSVLTDATEYLLDKKLEEKKHIVLIVLPASTFARSQFINTDEWKEHLIEEFEEFSDLHFHFLKADENVTKHLQSACAALNEAKVESIIFVGIDSLVDQLTYQELIEQDRLCSSTITDGVIPGEAAASIVIQNVDVKKDKPLAIIKGLTNIEEPNSGKAHSSKLTGLAQVIQSAAQIAGQVPDTIDCIVRNSTSERQTTLEWYQTTNTVWPNKLSEQESLAFQLGEVDEPPKPKPRKMPEELSTGQTLGEIGAASIPMSLVLACARFNFNHPAINNCLICEANEFPFRGAIFLENPLVESPVKA